MALQNDVLDMVPVLHVFEYEAVAMRPRYRKPIRWTTRETFVSPIPSYSSSAFEVRYGQKNPGMVTPQYLVADGRMFFPISSTMLKKVARDGARPGDNGYEDHSTHVESIRTGKTTGYQSGSSSAYVLPSVEKASPDLTLEERKAFVPEFSTLREITETNREERRALAEVDASHLCFVDEALHSSRFELVRTSYGFAHANGPVRLHFDLYKQDIYGRDSYAKHPPLCVPLDVDIPDAEENRDNHDLLDGLDLRHPTETIWLRTLVAASVHSIFRPMGGGAHFGGAAFSVPDIPEDLDEAVFDLRRSLRDLHVDLRKGPVSPDILDLALSRLETFRDIHRRENHQLHGIDKRKDTLARHLDLAIDRIRPTIGVRP